MTEVLSFDNGLLFDIDSNNRVMVEKAEGETSFCVRIALTARDIENGVCYEVYTKTVVDTIVLLEKFIPNLYCIVEWYNLFDFLWFMKCGKKIK